MRLDKIDIRIVLIMVRVNPHALWALHLKVFHCTPSRIAPHSTKTIQGTHFSHWPLFYQIGGGSRRVGWVKNNHRNDLYNAKPHGKIYGSLANPPPIRGFVNGGLVI